MSLNKMRFKIIGLILVIGILIGFGGIVASDDRPPIGQAPPINDTTSPESIAASENEAPQKYTVTASRVEAINTSQLAEYGEVGTQAGERIELTMSPTNVGTVENISWVINVRPVITSKSTNIPGSSDGESLGVQQAHQNGITGEGVKVGVIDGGFDTDNPAISSNIVDTKSFRETKGDPAHGTSVAESVLKTAPDSQLYVASTSTGTDTEAAIEYLSNQNIDIIVHSAGFPAIEDDGEHFLTDDITNVTKSGTLFVNSAGNDAQLHWEGNFRDTDLDDFHEWSTNGDEQNCIPNCNVEYSGDIDIFVKWDTNENSQSHYRPALYNPVADEYIAVDDDGVSRTQYGTSYTRLGGQITQSQAVDLVVERVEGSPNEDIEIIVAGPREIERNVPSSSITAPGDVSEALTVAAYQRGISRGLDGQYSRQLASYSSRGPTDDGRTGIDVTGYTNIRTTSNFYDPTFGGTSAAAPYVGGVAALIHEKQPTDPSPTELTNTLKSSSDDILDPGLDTSSGTGVVNATEAVETTGDSGSTSPSPVKVMESNYGNNQDNSINEIIPTSDGNYLLVGSNISDDNSEASVRKITPQGTVLWAQSYNSKFNQTISDGIQTQSGDFVLSGSTETADSYTGWGVKIDETGNKIWEVEQDNSEGALYDVEETSNDQYLFVGEYSSSEGDDNAEVMKVASGGSKIWDFSYYVDDERNYQDFFGIEQLETNRFVVVGQEQINGENWDAIVFKLDSNGEILSGEHYGHSILDDWFIDVAVTENGEPVYAGIRNGVYDDEANEYNFYDGWVYYDGSTSTWSKEVTIDNLNQFSSISIDRDRIVAGGVSLAEEGSQRDGIVVEYGLDGTRNWRLTTDESGDYSVDDVFVSGNDTYVAGEIYISDSNNFDGSLRKYTTATDSNTDNKVQLTNLELSQNSISNNSESDRTLTFDALNISSDDQQDNFTVTMPESVELVAVTDVAETNGNYDVSYSKNGNAIQFHVDPNRDVDSVDLAFEVDMTLTGRG